MKEYRQCLWIDSNFKNFKNLILNLLIRLQFTSESLKITLWSFTPTLCVSNAKVLTLEAEKIVWQRWTRRKMQEVLLKQNSWYAQIVVIFQSKTAQNMVKILFSSNVNFVVVLLNGFAGEILIFVNLVIKDSVMETM